MTYQKGRVERSILYIRRAFFMARRFRDVEDLNRQAQQWCDGPACQRRWVEDDRLTVGEAFEKERALLLPLPQTPFPTDERRELSVGKTPYVRFDHNDYSLPHELVRQTVVVVASLQTVRIMHRGAVVAEHAPAWWDRVAVTPVAALVSSADPASHPPVGPTSLGRTDPPGTDPGQAQATWAPR